MPQRDEHSRLGARPSQTSAFCSCDEAWSGSTRQKGRRSAFTPHSAFHRHVASGSAAVSHCRFFSPGGEGVSPASPWPSVHPPLPPPTSYISSSPSPTSLLGARLQSLRERKLWPDGGEAIMGKDSRTGQQHHRHEAQVPWLETGRPGGQEARRPSSSDFGAALTDPNSLQSICH